MAGVGTVCSLADVLERSAASAPLFSPAGRRIKAVRFGTVNDLRPHWFPIEISDHEISRIRD